MNPLYSPLLICSAVVSAVTRYSVRGSGPPSAASMTGGRPGEWFPLQIGPHLTGEPLEQRV
jgi:hypothetical protein